MIRYTVVSYVDANLGQLRPNHLLGLGGEFTYVLLRSYMAPQPINGIQRDHSIVSQRAARLEVGCYAAL